MDIHHVTNKTYSKQLFENYITKKGLSIALTEREHYLLTKYSKKDFTNKSQLVVFELDNISNYTNVPQDILRKLRLKIKERYL